MKNIRIRLNRALSVLGGAGVLGIGLLLFGAAVFYSWIVPAQGELAVMQRKAATQQERAGMQAPRQRPQEPLSDFYEFFPPVDSGAEWLAKLYAIAERERLDLPKSEYRLTSTPEDSIASYQAVFSLKGSYHQLRAFIASVLEEIPIAALDDVRLEKQHTADSTVDARIRLTFFLRMR